jgi:Uma2 family endonuclease
MPVLELSPPAPISPSADPDHIPPLEDGDRLSHEEFMRRYEAMPGVKAELIDGVVYMASPVRLEQHGEPHGDLAGWLTLYRSQHPGVRLGVDVTVLLGGPNDPQPDACLLLPPERGGKARLIDGYVHGPPELMCEVAASTASFDAGPKAEAYHRAGVPEYLLWRTEQQRVEWFVRTDSHYRSLDADADGFLASQVFPGLKLDVDALLRGDVAAVLKPVMP